MRPPAPCTLARVLGRRCGLLVAGLGLALGCGQTATARHPIVLRDDHAAAIDHVERLRDVERYGRWHARMRAHRSARGVDAARDFWLGLRSRWPFGVEPVAGTGPYVVAPGEPDVAGSAKAVDGRVFAVRCGMLSELALDRGAETEQAGGARVRWRTLLARGNVLVATGLREKRGGATEIVRAFSAGTEGAPSPVGAIELRVGGELAAHTGHSRIVGDALVLVRSMRISRRAGPVPMPAVRAFDARGGSRWRPLLTERDVQRPVVHGGSLHVVIRCPLADLERSCTAHAILGDLALAQHTADASYLWMIEASFGGEHASPEMAVVRLPHDGSSATAVRTPGMPLGQHTWRARSDGSLDAVIRVLRDDGAPGSTVALLRVDAATLQEGVSGRVGLTAQGLLRDDPGYEPVLAFAGDTLLVADRGPGECRHGTKLRSRQLDEGSTTEIDVPGCVDFIDVGPTGVLLADWTTDLRTLRLWPLGLEPTLQLGEALDLEDALIDSVGVFRPTRTRHGSEELWTIPMRSGPTPGPATLGFVSLSGTQLRPRTIARRTPLVGADAGTCPANLEPPRAYGSGEQLLALLPGGWSVLELAP